MSLVVDLSEEQAREWLCIRARSMVGEDEAYQRDSACLTLGGTVAGSVGNQLGVAARVRLPLLHPDAFQTCWKHRVLPQSVNRGVLFVTTSRPNSGLVRRFRSMSTGSIQIVPATESELIIAIEDTFRTVLLNKATLALENNEPQFSARRVFTSGQLHVFSLLMIACAITAWFVPAADVVFAGVAAIGFLANAAFRAWLFWVGSEGMKERDHGSDDETNMLPVYTIIVPLYREANVVAQIAAALRRLDYPADRLDVKLVVEEDDLETSSAACAAAANFGFDILRVPAGSPRTKPRACNYALQFAEGEFLVVYDAEDQPEQDQLRKAVAAFRGGPPDVACLQARLNFFNAKENWITSGMLAHEDKTDRYREQPGFSGKWRESGFVPVPAIP